MIAASYTRNGVRYDWIRCRTAKFLWKTLTSLGAISDVKIQWT